MNRLLARDEFEDAVRAELDVLQARVRSLEARVKIRSTTLERLKGEVARTMRARRASFETALHRVHTVPTVEWATFKHEIAVAVAEIARDIESATPKAPMERVKIGPINVVG